MLEVSLEDVTQGTSAILAQIGTVNLEESYWGLIYKMIDSTFLLDSPIGIWLSWHFKEDGPGRDLGFSWNGGTLYLGANRQQRRAKRLGSERLGYLFTYGRMKFSDKLETFVTGLKNHLKWARVEEEGMVRTSKWSNYLERGSKFLYPYLVGKNQKSFGAVSSTWRQKTQWHKQKFCPVVLRALWGNRLCWTVDSYWLEGSGCGSGYFKL